MIYTIKEKFWSFGDHFTIRDEAGNECFYVKGKAFSWGGNLTLTSISGKPLADISRKRFSFRTKYEIYREGNLFAEVRKEFAWFKSKFTLDVSGPNDYSIQGSFWDHEFTFNREGRTVAKISKSSWGWSDQYGIDINDEEDHISILATCIIIDQVLDDQNRTNSD